MLLWLRRVCLVDRAGQPGYNTIHTNSKGAMGRYPAVLAHNADQVTFTSNQVFSWSSAKVRHAASLRVGSGCDAWIVTSNIFRHHTGEGLLLR